MKASPTIRDAMRIRQMRFWLLRARHSFDGCPKWRARKNYWFLVRKPRAFAERHGLEKPIVFEKPTMDNHESRISTAHDRATFTSASMATSSPATMLANAEPLVAASNSKSLRSRHGPRKHRQLQHAPQR